MSRPVAVAVEHSGPWVSYRVEARSARRCRGSIQRIRRRTRSGGGDVRVHHRSRSARGWNDHVQWAEVIGDGRVDGGGPVQVGVVSGVAGRGRDQQFIERQRWPAPAALVPAPIQGTMAGHRRQPGTGVGRHAVDRPPPGRLQQRLRRRSARHPRRVRPGIPHRGAGGHRAACRRQQGARRTLPPPPPLRARPLPAGPPGPACSSSTPSAPRLPSSPSRTILTHDDTGDLELSTPGERCPTATNASEPPSPPTSKSTTGSPTSRPASSPNTSATRHRDLAREAAELDDATDTLRPLARTSRRPWRRSADGGALWSLT